MFKNSAHGIKLAKLAFAGALLTVGLPAYSAEDTVIKPLISKELADLQGKEGLMLSIGFLNAVFAYEVPGEATEISGRQ